MGGAPILKEKPRALTETLSQAEMKDHEANAPFVSTPGAIKRK
jgi:hypothetical protein